jgi:hydroxymethylbilane synthase
MKAHLNIGTRQSPLALWQAEFVKAELQKNNPSLTVELVPIKTTGDKILDSPLSKIGDKGLFTREIEHYLLDGRIDLAVHSLKDLPTQTPDGLAITAITRREDTRDVLIAKEKHTVQTLPQHAVIATGSLRRRSQLLALRPDFKIVDIRGNLNTRFKKFDESPWDAMILAFAGVHRLGWDERISALIPHEEMLPAVGQGALGIETRTGDTETLALLTVLNDPITERCTKAERALLRHLEGGCQIPIGAFAESQENTLSLSAFVGSLDGTTTLRKTISAVAPDVAAAESLGTALAEALLKQGGWEILYSIRSAE